MWVAIIKDPLRDLRAPFYYFVINSTAADLIIGCLTEPGFIINHSKEAIKGQKLHVIWIFHLTYFASLTASLLSLSALTVDRCLTITSPLRRRLKSRHGYLTSTVIWCVSLSISFVYFAVKFYLFLFLFANTAALIVLATLVISHQRIAKTLKDHVRHWDPVDNSGFRRLAVAREKQLTRSFLVMLTLFCLSVFPSCIIAYVIGFCTTCNCDIINILRDGYFLLPMSISACNQLLYALRMRNFRRAFSFLFQSAVCDKLRSEPYLWTNKIMDTDERKAVKRATWMKHLPSRVYYYMSKATRINATKNAC